MKKLFIVLAMLVAMNANAQWVQMSGPSGGDIMCFAVSGSTMFSGAWESGVFRSTNNGASWVQVNNGLTSLGIRSLAVMGTKIFVGTGAGLFSSTNNGDNWTAVNIGLSNQFVTSLAVSGSTIFAGTEDNGIHRSTNNGTNWTAVNNGLINNRIRAITISGTNIFIGTVGNYSYPGVFRSTNNGDSWTPIHNGLSNLDIRALVSSGNNLFLSEANSLSVYRSTNNGDSWTLNAGLATSSFLLAGNNIYAGTNNGIYRSTNNGDNWTAINNGLTSLSVYSFCVNGTNIFAGCYGYNSAGGIFVSSNNGENWRPSGLPLQKVYCMTSIGNNLFTGTYCGVFLSTNNGGNWSATNLDQRICVLSLASSGTNLIAGIRNDGPPYFGGIFLSSNNGTNWTRYSLSSGLSVTTLAISGNNIFAGTSDSGVFRSTNNGTNWTKVNIGITNLRIKSFAISGTNIFAGTLGGGVFLTTNNGTNWTPVSGGLTSLFVRSLVASGSNLFSGTDNGVFKSTNNGANWVQIGLNNKLVPSLMISGSNLLAGTAYNGGVYLTTNNGVNWFEKNQGFIADGFGDYAVVNVIFVINNQVFVGTEGRSVYSRSLSEIIGIQNISTETPSAYSLEQNYPNPFNPSTKIKFTIVSSPHVLGGDLVQLNIYDIQGREVQTLVNERLQPGMYEAAFDGSALNTGVYFYKLITNGFTETKKMLLIK